MASTGASDRIDPSDLVKGLLELRVSARDDKDSPRRSDPRRPRGVGHRSHGHARRLDLVNQVAGPRHLPTQLHYLLNTPAARNKETPSFRRGLPRFHFRNDLLHVVVLHIRLLAIREADDECVNTLRVVDFVATLRVSNLPLSFTT